MVEISEKEYQELQDRSFILQCLESGGVSSWDWYDASMAPYRRRKAKETLYDNFIDSLNEVLATAEVGNITDEYHPMYSIALMKILY